MSLFGEDDEGFAQAPKSKALFGEDASAPKPTSSSSLFADDNTASDSPWGMPTPKKAARGDMIRNLLPASAVPESYIDAFDIVLNSGDRQGSNISADGAKKLLESSGISQEEQTRLIRVVAPSGADAGLGRSELNVLLALIGLSQEGEEATLDGVDERRAKLPEPRLPYLDKLKTTQPAENAPQPVQSSSAEQNKKPASSSPSKSRILRRDSLLDPSSDPWASPATPKQQTKPVKNDATPSQQQTMSRPVPDNTGTRTTSTFTTNSENGDDDGLPAPSPGAGGWGSGFSNGDTSGLSSAGAFGDDEPAISASRPLPARAPRTGGAGVEETVTITLLPEKEGMFMFQHRNYEVKSARRASTVVRRYSDFVWLLDCLHKRYPFRQLPLLPPKKLAVVNGRHLSSDAAFIEKRRKGLVRFTNALVRHPILKEEQLVVMFLTVPTELAVWRKQATISVQEEFVGKPLPPSLEDSLPTNLLETFDTVRSGVRRSSETYIGLCNLLERLAKRNQGVAADSLRFSQALRSLTEETEATYSTDTNDVPALNEGIKSTAKHLETSHSLLEDEARAWDEGVLEDLKRQRDSLVSVRDMFDRRDRYAKDNIPQLERRIEANEVKLQTIRAKPEGTAKAGEAEKVEQAIINDKQSIVDQHARGVFIKECIRDELAFFQSTQFQVSRLHQDWSQERVKYAELMADNWRALSDEVENMPLSD